MRERLFEMSFCLSVGREWLLIRCQQQWACPLPPRPQTHGEGKHCRRYSELLRRIYIWSDLLSCYRNLLPTFVPATKINALLSLVPGNPEAQLQQRRLGRGGIAHGLPKLPRTEGQRLGVVVGENKILFGCPKSKLSRWRFGEPIRTKGRFRLKGQVKARTRVLYV